METPFEKPPIEQLDGQTEQASRATQKELTQSMLDGLRSRLADTDIECVEDREYLRFKRGGTQVGIVFKMPGGNRTVVRLDSNLQKTIKEFESSIPPESIFVATRYKDSADFTFFPNLTNKEVTILQAEIEPIGGHIVIVQGEYVVVNSQDETHLISTFGIDSCRGMIMYDPEKGIVAITHSDTEYADASIIEQMRRDLIEVGANPDSLKFYGTPNIDPQERQYIIDKMFSETAYKVPSKFTFDCTTGLITPFNIGSLSQSENLDQRMKDEIDIRLKHNIPYIKKGVKNLPPNRERLGVPLKAERKT